MANTVSDFLFINYIYVMANIDHKPSKYVLNLQHVLPAFVDKDKKIINGLIEITPYTINKYEYITEAGILKLDRVWYSSMAYPITYGLIPQTWDDDNDLLDVVVAGVTEALIPGTLAELRIIGIMKFEDGGERDDKVITVLADDKRMEHITSYQDLWAHWAKEVEHYFEFYKHLKKPGTCKPLWFFDADEAVKIIQECEARYVKDYLPKFE
jgi:inorganic pyrophosphatase